jgi:hypothetical protein
MDLEEKILDVYEDTILVFDFTTYTEKRKSDIQ